MAATHVLHPADLSLKLGQAAEQDDFKVERVIGAPTALLLLLLDLRSVCKNSTERRELLYPEVRKEYQGRSVNLRGSASVHLGFFTLPR